MATTHKLSLEVSAPDHLTKDEVKELLFKLFSVGQADARDSATDEDLSEEAIADAQDAAALDIGISE